MDAGSRLRLVVALGLATFVVAFNAPLTRSADAAPTTTTTVSSSCPPTVSSGPPTLPAPPTGIIAFDIYKSSQGTSPFLPSIWSNTAISGVDLAIGWDDLEPDLPYAQQGTPTPIHWSVLDCLFYQADRSGKFVVLTIIPGFHTPRWALKGVRTQNFAFQYGEPPYPATLPLPLPWNQTYLHRWYAFLGAVANRYETNPAFRMVAVDGPSSVSGEMTLPFGTGDPAILHKVVHYINYEVKVDGSDVTMWQVLGYTPDLFEAAWSETFNQFASIFHDKYISLALIAGLPIGNTAKSSGLSLAKPSPLDPSQKTATPLTIIAEGKSHASQFVLQENGLAAQQWPVAVPGTTFNFVEADCASNPTGYQTKDPPNDGIVPDVVDEAVNSGVGFLELYAQDIGKVSQAALAAANTALKKNVNCHPLTLQATPTFSSLAPAISLTATTTLDLKTGDTLNIFEGSQTVATCHQSPCHVTILSTLKSGTFTANVSYANQPPLVTTSTNFTRS
jgi:hypothetical protein